MFSLIPHFLGKGNHTSGTSGFSGITRIFNGLLSGGPSFITEDVTSALRRYCWRVLLHQRWEGLLTTETRLGNRYRKHRHGYLLGRGVKCLQRILPGATAYINLHYEFEGVRPELDALVQYDSVLIVLEAKGAPLTPPARRGAPDRLERDLRRIVSDAHAQGHRAYRFLREGSGRFRLGDGTAMQVDLGSFEEVFVVSLHLEPLGHLTALSHAVEAMGLPTDGPEQSWMVSLYDLMVLSDVLDIPSMFPHYVKRRLRVGRQGFIDAHDELDFFCYYLQEGPFFR